MAKAFSVASWNVEHFGKSPARIPDIIQFLAQQNADVVAIYEVESSVVFEPIITAVPGYQFHITEGEQYQEILVGIKHGISAFVTQKLEFKSGQSTLRPGVLVTVMVDGKFYPLLFLHLKSLSDPKGFGLRDDMIARAFKFRSVLDEAAGGQWQSNYIFMGDLNTMGLEYPYGDNIPPTRELERLQGKTDDWHMKQLTKTAPYTWWNGPDSSLPMGNLDHVVAAEHLTFADFNGSQVDVRGWPQEPDDQAKAAWIQKHSDHGLLYFEVQKV